MENINLNMVKEEADGLMKDTMSILDQFVMQNYGSLEGLAYLDSKTLEAIQKTNSVMERSEKILRNWLKFEDELFTIVKENNRLLKEIKTKMALNG